MTSKEKIEESLIIRKPLLNDSKLIYDLVFNSPPLEINSLYSYLLICSHFDQTSAVAEIKGEIVGYTSAYINPHKNDTLFIWQIAVKDNVRGNGIAKKMILNILKRKKLRRINHIETTVTQENTESKSLFYGVAANLNAQLKEDIYFTREVFGEAEHSEEIKIRIGPVRQNAEISVLTEKTGTDALLKD